VGWPRQTKISALKVRRSNQSAVERNALRWKDAPALLKALDRHRDRICRAACLAYTKRRKALTHWQVLISPDGPACRLVTRLERVPLSVQNVLSAPMVEHEGSKTLVDLSTSAANRCC
jgi:hypothetical protein